MMKAGQGRELVAEADRLLARVDRTLADVGWRDGIAARVERTLRSAAPAIGVRYWSELRDAYDRDRANGARSDEAWDELLRGPSLVGCGCDAPAWCDARHRIGRNDVMGLDEVAVPLTPWGVTTWNDEVLRLQRAGVLPVGV